MLQKIVLQVSAMCVQLTDRPPVLQDLQPIQAILFVDSQVIPQRIERNPHELANVFVLESLAFQQQCFHPLLHTRMGMMKSFVSQLVQFFLGKCHMEHGRSFPTSLRDSLFRPKTSYENPTSQKTQLSPVHGIPMGATKRSSSDG